MSGADRKRGGQVTAGQQGGDTGGVEWRGQKSEQDGGEELLQLIQELDQLALVVVGQGPVVFRKTAGHDRQQLAKVWSCQLLCLPKLCCEPLSRTVLHYVHQPHHLDPLHQIGQVALLCRQTDSLSSN